jgi:hypothetical protein
LKPKDNEECSESSVIPNKLDIDETPLTISAVTSAIGQPEVKYAQPVK